MEREKIEQIYKWDIESFYDSEEKFEEQFKGLDEKIEKMEDFKGSLAKGADELFECLSMYEEILRTSENLYVYAHMKKDEDNRNSKYQALSGKAEMLSTRISTATSFMVPEIISMDEKLLAEFVEDERLIYYKRYIDEIIRKKPYVLSQSEERILALSGDMSSAAENAFEMLSFADMKFPHIKDDSGKETRITHANFMTFMKSKSRDTRKEAFEKLYSTYEGYKNTIGATLSGAVKREIFYSRARGHESAIKGSLFEDNISVDVYENLIDAVSEKLEPMYKYVQLKKDFLGVDKLHMYDIYAPLVDDVDMKIPYEKAKEIILEALKPLGEEYRGIIKKAFDERWIDVYENDGKKGGAYSWGSYDSKPYILMNYKEDLNSMFTLVHELGHSVHSYYSRSSQPYIDAHYKIFVAEVASTLNELLLMQYMLENAKNKSEKLYILNYHLEQFRTTVYRQTMFAEFEKTIHERSESGQALTGEDFSQIYYDLNKKYYGEGMEIDSQIAIEWARVPHFYSNFYVYKYATGFSAAAALSFLIMNDGESAQKKYIEFLKSGGSKYPLDQLRDAGVDMEDKSSVLKALELFEKAVEKLSLEDDFTKI